MKSSACILGCSGPVLTAEEKAFFARVRPWGFILFARNVESPAQVLALTEALRATVGRPDAPILIDQEGGRVQRMGPPHWGRYPPGRAYGEIAMWGEYDYVIVNDDFDAAYAELAHIYHAERLRRTRNPWLRGFVQGLLDERL